MRGGLFIRELLAITRTWENFGVLDIGCRTWSLDCIRKGRAVNEFKRAVLARPKSPFPSPSWTPLTVGIALGRLVCARFWDEGVCTQSMGRCYPTTPVALVKAKCNCETSCNLLHNLVPRAFPLKKMVHPFFKGKALGTRLSAAVII